LEARPLELDSIYALPLARAEQEGIDTPSIRMLHALLDLGETG
ncbi:MAG: 2-dehydropantoate 2-reductase, partial [candidate division Zixibacteria bacterium]|nr:2-dehydropantoate 2-reductase [Gammaproteobacteria bacterium]NIT53885.1 2-dehydropantoate 2-reductase [candidate division Zixibacteria bacterium]NIW42334.1 2-dehydropantoate 2-reductase [candidate division Zixibacteria bacterium]NIX55473.1 2-dehydropantoate 2-reductase [candidate division Zixibacteria bacterium]